MVRTVTSRVPDTALWSGNGGDATMRSYGLPMPRNFEQEFCWTGEQRESLARQTDDARWLGALPLWHEDEHRIFVHDGAPDEARALESQDISIAASGMKSPSMLHENGRRRNK
jgi:hypothetical protein